MLKMKMKRGRELLDSGWPCSLVIIIGCKQTVEVVAPIPSLLLQSGWTSPEALL